MRQRFFCGSGRSDGLLSDLPGVEGFFAGEAQAEEADGGDEKKAGFDEKLAPSAQLMGAFFKTGSVKRLCQKSAAAASGKTSRDGGLGGYAYRK